MDRLKSIKGYLKVNTEMEDLIRFYEFLNYTKTQDGDQSILNYTGFYFLMEEIVTELDINISNYAVSEKNMAYVFTKTHRKYNVQNLRGGTFNAQKIGYKNYLKINNKLKLSGFEIKLVENEYGACSILTKI